MWTQFHDMHSGGGQKLEWGRIFIEAPEAEARSIFYGRFGRNPDRVTCTCCGADYSISEHLDLERGTAYERNCEWVSDKKEHGGGHYLESQKEDNMQIRRSRNTPDESTWGLYMTLDAFIKSGKVKIIPASEISETERCIDVPEEGYVWRE